MSQDVDQALAEIRKLANEVPAERVYFTLRKLRVKPLPAKTVETVRLCLACQKLGLPITTNLLAALTKKDPKVICDALHILGDKKVLTIIRGSTTIYHRWLISQEFLNHWNPNPTKTQNEGGASNEEG